MRPRGAKGGGGKPAADGAETLRLDMSKHWTPTAESYFRRVSKKGICLAVAEAAGESVAFRIQDLKKPVMAAEAETMT